MRTKRWGRVIQISCRDTFFIYGCKGNVLQEHQRVFEELFLNTDSLWEQAGQGPTVGDIAIPYSI